MQLLELQLALSVQFTECAGRWCLKLVTQLDHIIFFNGNVVRNDCNVN